MGGLDVIGDVHGHASKLEERLRDLGYAIDPNTGAYRHSERSAVFVGDLIDRGPEQLRVLQIVKAMVDSGSARMVLGNHEFNAIAYATEHPDRPGAYLRPHNDKNNHQHAEFLKQLTGEQQKHYIDWFRTLPLWLDLGGLRVVHACWHEPSMEVVRAVCGSDRLARVEHLVAASTKGDALYDAVEILLKGPEISLVDYGQPPYVDKDGHPREKARVRWWHHGASTLADLAEVKSFKTADGNPYPQPPAIQANERDRSFVYNADIPLVYGHYWRQDPPVHLDDWTAHTACVDFSAGKGGTLVAYRWDGQPTIALENYVPHGADVVAQTDAELNPATGYHDLGRDVWYDADGTGYIAMNLTGAVPDPQPLTIDGVVMKPKGEYHCSIAAVPRYESDPAARGRIAAAVKEYLREHDLRYVGLGDERYLCRKDDRMTVVAPVEIDGFDELIAFLGPLLDGYQAPFPHVTLLKNAGAEYGVAVHCRDDLERYCELLAR